LSYLIDTTVVSELMRLTPNPGVDGFVRAAPIDSLHTSVIVVGEILAGIRELPAGERRKRLLEQFSFLHARLDSRVLPVGEQTVEHWADIRAGARARGKRVPAVDALVAATAMEHDLTVVTRNARDFVAAGAKVLNPWT
jgi:predicted nucleic acid-binding protein